ncbi:tRNA (adenosine(37)-N6)-threonylcarbamoyltransferase complex ATPase subunit type 1 TsaE [Lacinutrix iliipiscaria]|uniref:tRNA threonylcarbamoyladenosine biosynthesis protein TsaE n=1 Tax=Lacinutrix iliipiscaria TaxID=1230532 RepID=A0ABW5WMV0_9FLAO
MEINYTINNLEEVAKTLLEHSKSKILLFHGSMGVGKTTLIKALVKALGSADDVQSPTYSIVNEYQGTPHSIYHFDLYRINDLEDVYNFGFEDYLNESDWILIEWPELVIDILPEDAQHVFLELNNDNTRKIVINNPKSKKTT